MYDDVVHVCIEMGDMKLAGPSMQNVDENYYCVT